MQGNNNIDESRVKFSDFDMILKIKDFVEIDNNLITLELQDANK